jgi:Rrf2 family nitric oxide-sensitive transcriptional repressor
MFTDYSLRVLIYAAIHTNRRCVTSEIAAAFHISINHVIKVVHALQRFGYIETVRGRSGGFKLAKPPEHIRLGDVVRDTEGSLSLVECFDQTNNTCPLTHACGLQYALMEGFDAFFAVLDRYSLADLVSRPHWVERVVMLNPEPGNAVRRM